MSGVKIAQVAVEQTAYHFDKPFDYYLPLDIVDRVKIGQRVMVPFGRGNTKRQGIVLDILDGSDIEKLKPIVDVLDDEPLLNDEMLMLGKFISDHTFSPLFDSYKVLLPAGTTMRIITKYQAKEDLNPDNPSLNSLSEKEREAVLILINSRGLVARDKLLKILDLPQDSTLPEKLVKAGFLTKTADAKRKVNDPTIKMATLTDEYLSGEILDKITEKQKKVVDLLTEIGTASTKEISYFTGVTTAVISALERKNVIAFFDEEICRNTYSDRQIITDTAEIELTKEQNSAYENMLKNYNSGKSTTTLLYGITGSGKTKVYMKLIDKVMADNKGAILLIPEISLTPQTLDIFHKRYGSKVAVFHSALSLGQRLDEWKRVKRGEATLAIGTRSAIFAPIDNLGIVIIDEEQEATYKSESTPRFDAKDIAKFRAGYHKSLLVLGSATPSVTTYALAKNNKYNICELENRYKGAKLPDVITLDMCEEETVSQGSIISEKLYDMLKVNLEEGNQSILLLNRRGYNTFVSCRSCGEVITCPNCSISMTYHSANNRLMCHYCGHSIPFSNECPKCHQNHIRYSGVGTQKVEEELKNLLPDAKILRMDADTTTTRLSHDKKFTAFKNREYDIMLGTQMIAKGLNFPDVTLVGVLNADNSLFNSDYRSGEQTFSLLTQVIGRAGRGAKKGKAVIQTFNPENTVIELAEKQDYKAFYDLEISKRKLLIYPPYCDLCVIGFVSSREDKAKGASEKFFKLLKNKITREQRKMILLGPAPASITKISNKYRYLLTIKCYNNKETRKLITETIKTLSADKYLNSVTLTADFNPYYY
jgi:primosomal protein N' (replication factor Y)